MKTVILCLFILLILIQQLIAQEDEFIQVEAPNEDDSPDRAIIRPKRGFLDNLALTDFNWFHKFLEMIFGDFYTDLVDTRNTVLFTPAPPKSSFETAFKPWIKNISLLNNLRPYTKQSPNVPQVNLPYPHIFTTPKSRRPTTTTSSTEAPTTSTMAMPTPPSFNAMPPSTAFFERLSLPFTHKPAESPTIQSKNVENQQTNTCNCQAGKQCSLKLKSFETNDPVFQYAYSHGTPMTELLDSIMRESQVITLPHSLSWKITATPETVQLTTSLMNLYKPNRSLVIGVFTGLAIVGIASVMDSRGIVIGLEYPEYVNLWEKVGMKYAQRAGIMNRIQVRSVESIDKALAKLAAYEPNAFDFIFINEIRKDNSLDDYEHAVRLLRTNGLLVITNGLDNGSVIAGSDYSNSEGRQVIQSMNSRVKSDPRVNASLLPYGGGTWIIVKN